MNIRTLLAVIISAGALASACASDRVTTLPSAARPADGVTASETPGDRNAPGTGSKSRGAKNQETAEPDRPGSQGNNGGNGGPEASPPGTAPARTSASLTDPAGDEETSGDTPDYADMLRADLRGRGKTLVIRTVVAGSLPSTMADDDTFMGIETRIERKGKRYSIIAEGDHNGWRAFVSRNGKNRAIRDPAVENDQVVAVVPWRMIGGPGRLSWETYAGWTRSTITETHYAFDAVPDHGAARYPQAR